jgi:hypothetical protein
MKNGAKNEKNNKNATDFAQKQSFLKKTEKQTSFLFILTS